MIGELTLFGRRLSPYGLFFVTGLYLAVGLFLWLAPKRGLSRLPLALTTVFSVLGGLAGAKLLYVLTRWSDFIAVLRRDGAAFLRIVFNGGGFVFFGGLAGGLLTAFLLLRRAGQPVLPVFDVAAPALALGQAIGRLGCLSVGCCYGVPSPSFGIVFPEQALAPGGIALFPTQLLESLFLLILSGLLVMLLFRRGVGLPTAVYALAGGTFRFLLEFWRGDAERGRFLIFSTSQWIALVLIGCGLWLLRRLSVERRPAA